MRHFISASLMLLLSGLLCAVDGPVTTSALVAPLPLVLTVDDADALHVRYEGQWRISHTVKGFFGTGYHYAAPGSPQPTRAIYTPTIPVTGLYEVSVEFPAYGGRSPATPITIQHLLGRTTVLVDQRTGNRHVLGRFWFATPSSGSGAPSGIVIRAATTNPSGTVIIDGAGAKGYVIADTVRFTWIPQVGGSG